MEMEIETKNESTVSIFLRGIVSDCYHQGIWPEDGTPLSNIRGI